MSGNWENWDGIKFPKWEPKIATAANTETGDIKQSVSHISGEISTWIYKTRDEHLRNALIALGWTPPQKDQPDYMI